MEKGGAHPTPTFFRVKRGTGDAAASAAVAARWSAAFRARFQAAVRSEKRGLGFGR
jgi:hypothetical protein